LRGGDELKALVGTVVNGAIAEIDQLFRMAERELRSITDVARVCGRGSISATERRRECWILNRAVPAAVANLLKLAVPAGERQPHLGFDVGVR
jgi:hypothetical protein